jgi:5'-phosphate synthase pdxT subunit
MSMTSPRIGVLALQGDFREHLAAVRELGAEPAEVRLPHDLETVDALIIPGGESTTIGRLATLYGMIDPLRKHIELGLPTLGTCAGMIVLASRVTEGSQPQLGALDATVERNAFGRQNESFEVDLDIVGFAEPMRAVFIRAPLVEEVGPDVAVLAVHDGRPVFVRQDNVLAAAFHPELTGDLRIHEMLIEMVDTR